jgi:DNA-binding IclR family transcriptional regulator
MSALEKSLDIIEAILYHKDEISIVDLAKATGQSLGTTHRICSILVRRGYLYQKEKGAEYSLGYKFLLFNNIANASINIKTMALPFMKELAGKISETVVLAVLDGFEPVDILSAVPDTILKATQELGTKSPLYCTAVGKIFIAYMPNELKERVLNSHEFTNYTDRTITDIDRLKAELAIVSMEGVAFDNEEYVFGLRSAAAPIRGENGEFFASVYYWGPSVRINYEKMRQLGPLVKDCALAISTALGYKGQ